MSAKNTTPSFCLAGEIVCTPEHASRILRRAIRLNQRWLIPQARSVREKLRRSLDAQKGSAA